MSSRLLFVSAHCHSARCRLMGVLLDPVPGNIDPAADPHVLVALHVVEEVRERDGPSGPAHQSQ